MNNYINQTPNMPMYNGYNNYRLPTYEVIKVNGRGGANAFQMGPNSSILLLDETDNIVWLAQTDGAGYQVSQLQMAQATAGVVRYPNSWTFNAGQFPNCFCGGCGN